MLTLPRSTAVKTHTVLCVDDEPRILEALAAILGRRYCVELASSGKAALELLRARPDTAVIISDMRMPTMNGAQFLAASRDIAPHARRILLTGHADNASAILAVNEGGIFRYLTKPCDFATLLDAVKAAITEYEEELHERSAIRRIVTQELLSRDLLTGLASRGLLLERLDLCRSAEDRGDWRPEVVFAIEVSNIEELSGGYDSSKADRLIRLVSTKLQEAIPMAECLARYRDATFVALLIPAEAEDAALESFAAGVVEALGRPFEIDGSTTQIRVNVGIARIAVGSDPRHALRHAELAAREAKRQGNQPLRLFSQESILKNERRRETIQALRDAVTQQQLSLFYQPIVDVVHHRIYSLEALARWEHATMGFVSPNTFIPLAEEIGLMAPLGEWIMNRACAEGRSLLGQHCPRISINVSVAQILDSRFLYGLHRAIETSGIDTAALELELTETVFAEDVDRVCNLLMELRQLGVSVAIDDFGSGYSSLAYLSRLPVDVLKIDKSFVQNLDRGGEAIIGAAISVAHTLKIEVIVEGIETSKELSRVRSLGATKVQGFYFARPMPAADMLKWYENFDNLGGAQ